MEAPQERLRKGLAIIQDFLTVQGFKLSEEKYETALHRDADSRAISKYTSGDKVISFYFKYWLYNITYSYKDKRVDHHTYFNLINRAGENKFPGYQNDNFLIPFENALTDLFILKEDFFTVVNTPILSSFIQSELDNLSERLNNERINGNFRW